MSLTFKSALLIRVVTYVTSKTTIIRKNKAISKSGTAQ